MEQPPNSPAGSEPDLPKPPIWERSAIAATPPIQIPSAPASRPIVPEITQRLPIQPPAAAVPPGPAPASGVGVTDRPAWPTAPPVIGQTTSPETAQPTKRKRRRTSLVALALLLTAAVAAGGFFFGRSVGSTETTTTPIAAAPTVEVPEQAIDVPEPTTPPATAAPAPTPVPAAPPVNDAPSLVNPGEGADEPVAAVARAVAPAVVLIQTDDGQGSGIIYDASGLILTNAHVVGDATDVLVTLASGVGVPGIVRGADPQTDVAVVEIDTGFEFGVAVLAPESSVEVGQLAVAIGSPFGLEQTVTSGIVSAKGRAVENRDEQGNLLSVVAMTQTDAPINPGNSGGALADREGRVIGMNTRIIGIRDQNSAQGQPIGSIGLGFAVPADTAKLIADRILAGRSLEQGFLGINGGTPAIGEPGVVISAVTEGSGADNAGLLSGDLIVGFNGGEIKSMSDLAAAVRLQPPNATVTVEFVRDGQNFLVDVTLGLFGG